MSDHQLQCATNYFAHAKCDCSASKEGEAVSLLDAVEQMGEECKAQITRIAKHAKSELDSANAKLGRLRAELAAIRHELEGAKKSARAQARIIASLEQQMAHLHAQRDQWIEARDTLDSERAANARLTEELAASREREARMRALIADDSYAMTFQTFGQYRTALLRALAEGAQG